MAQSKSLKKAVKAEVKDAATEAKTGNVETVPEKKGGPVDLPTGTRSHPPA